MKPALFDYTAPDTIGEALSVLAEHGPDATLLAGGQTLVPLLALRMAAPALLIDLNRVADLAGISREGAATRIGAMTRQAAVLADATVGARLPVLARATAFVGHHQTRNRGTIGGSVALADPAAELPAAALALDATIEARSVRGTREIAADDFFLGPYATALAADELLTAVRFPDWPAGSVFAVDEIAPRAGDFALVGLACRLAMEGGRVIRARIAWFGMGPTPLRAREAESAMTGRARSELDLRALAAAALAGTDPPSDVHADAAYRLSAGAALFERAVGGAIGLGKAAA